MSGLDSHGSVETLTGSLVTYADYPQDATSLALDHQRPCWAFMQVEESPDKISRKLWKRGRQEMRMSRKLSVTPRYGRLEDDGTVKAVSSLEDVSAAGKEIFCIEVKNLRRIAIRILQVGFTLKGSKIRCMIPEPNTIDREPFERSLQFRQTVTAYFYIQRTTARVDKAYVVTDDGEVYSRKSPVLDEIRWRTYDPFD
jgi:hypothetical protein